MNQVEEENPVEEEDLVDDEDLWKEVGKYSYILLSLRSYRPWVDLDHRQNYGKKETNRMS